MDLNGSNSSSLSSAIVQQQFSNLAIRDLTRTNRVLKEIRSLKAVEPLKRVHVEIKTKTFSVASFDVFDARTYGQTGIICELRIIICERNAIYGINDWCNGKQII